MGESYPLSDYEYVSRDVPTVRVAQNPNGGKVHATFGVWSQPSCWNFGTKRPYRAYSVNRRQLTELALSGRLCRRSECKAQWRGYGVV